MISPPGTNPYRVTRDGADPHHDTLKQVNEMSDEAEIYLGVDVGGTHTDLIMARDSQLTRAKALTTHGDYSQGVMDALGVAARGVDESLESILKRTRMFVNATTLVTNVVTELKGARVGILVTHGFRDAFRFAGGARQNLYDDHQQTNPPDVVDRDCIEEIHERVGEDGTVYVPVDETQVREAAERLRGRNVEAIAVCYLWSFKNDRNEQRTLEILKHVFPGAFVTLSSEIFPVMRETPRWLTAVFNCMSFKAATEFIETLADHLKKSGFQGRLSFFQGIGGTISIDTARNFPIRLLASGPAAGVTGSRHLAQNMGIENVLAGDMGGTSFDASLIEDGEIDVRNRVSIGPFETGINVVDVISVGAGGGSIAGIDERGVPQVGPRSAGSEPGPVCYGRGGHEPTVTDAMVAMGFIDPDNYLGGQFSLDRSAADQAIRDRLADPLGWSAVEAAASIHDLVVTNMANALRKVSVERGHDPREFTMMAYGGTLPLFVVPICREIDIDRIVIPKNSSVFSAYGLMTADYVRKYNRTVEWRLRDTEQYTRVNRVARRIREQALADARREGFEPEDLTLIRTGEFRFQGQAYEVSVPLDDRPLTPEDARRYAERFPEIYEQEYGSDTAWRNSPVEMLTYSLTARGRQDKPSIQRAPPGEDDPETARRGSRSVYLPRQHTRVELPVYREPDFEVGMSLDGPAIMDSPYTTIHVPERWSLRRDEWQNLLLTSSSVSSSGGTR